MQKKNHKHLRSSKQAVSELVGTILILAITVLLFSTVLFYVSQIPAPENNTNIDFSTNTLILNENPVKPGYFDTTMEVTMKGGEPVYDSTISIILFINDVVNSTKRITDSAPSIGNDWSVGETWTYNLTDLPADPAVRIMILDINSNSIVWESKLTLPVTLTPVIGQRGTNTNDSVLPIIGQYSQIWCYAYDYDGAVASVQADLSSIGEGAAASFTPKGANYWVSSNWYNVSSVWNGATIVLRATDDQGYFASDRMTLSAIENETAPVDNSTGLEPRNVLYSKNSGFNIFEKIDFDANGFDATPQYNFTLNVEDAAVVVVSKSMLNLDSKNYISVMYASNKTIIYEKASNAFTRYRYVSGFYSYKSYLPIDSPAFVNDMTYIVNIKLEDNSDPSNMVYISKNITTGSGGTYPTMKIYSDAGYSNQDYSYYNNEVFYVEIKSSAFPSGAAFYPSGGEVIMRDFVGSTQVKMSLPSTSAAWNGPVSGMTKSSATTYRFAMNMTAAKLGDPWIPGKNQTYTLTFDLFVLDDSGTFSTYYLSAILNITSPVFSGGIAAGIVQGVTPAIPSYGATMGISAWTQSSSMLYYVNDNTWTPPEYMEPFNQWSDYRPQCLLTTSGDMNGDNQNNEVVSYLTLAKPAADDSPSNAPVYYSYWVPKLVLYTRDNGDGWSSTVIKTMTQTGVTDGATNFVQIKSLAIGNVDMDDDKDVVFGMANGSLGICRNDGFWSYRQLCKVSSSIIAVAIVDLDPYAATHDRTRSLDIVFACSNGAVYILRNQNGMGVYLTTPTTVTTPSLTYVTSLCVGDMNNDISNDLVVVGGTGAGGFVCVGYNAALQGGTPTISAVLSNRPELSSTNAPKTNVTIGNYLTKDNYPDIAIGVGGMSVASGYGGVWIVRHTYAGSHTYAVPVRQITNIATDTEAGCVAKIQCMVSVDIDNDGLLDLVVGTGDWKVSTTRNEWRGNVLIFLNKDGTGAFAQYIVDNTGVPTRSVTVVI